MTLARNSGAVVLAAAWLLSVSQGTFFQANAQAQSPSPGPSDPTTAIPDQKLDAAAAVLERIASLKKDYEEQMVAAPASDKKRIAAEAFSAFQKAVTDQGLSVNEYILILEVAQNDPEVGDKIRQRLPTSPIAVWPKCGRLWSLGKTRTRRHSDDRACYREFGQIAHGPQFLDCLNAMRAARKMLWQLFLVPGCRLETSPELAATLQRPKRHGFSFETAPISGRLQPTTQMIA